MTGTKNQLTLSSFSFACLLNTSKLCIACDFRTLPAAFGFVDIFAKLDQDPTFFIFGASCKMIIGLQIYSSEIL